MKAFRYPPKVGLSGGALAACALAVVSPAYGQGRVAMTSFELAEDLAAASGGPIVEALTTGLGDAASAVMTPEEVADRLAPAGLEWPCETASCVTDVGRALDAVALLHVRASQVGQIYSFQARLLAADDGSELAQSAESCDVCTWAEALTAVERLGRNLAARLPGAVVVTVSPAGATLTVDGAPLEPGTRLQLEPGSHRVTATLEGHVTTEREIDVGPGSLTELSFALTPTPSTERDDPPPPASPPAAEGALTTWGWVTAGAALAALVPGVLWLALEGQCVIGGEEQDGICTRIYYTWPQGLAAAGLGAALAATSVALFVLGSRRQAAVAVSLGPTPSGVAGAVVGSF